MWTAGPPSDDALAEAVRGGDEAAFAELWLRHGAAATRAAAKITGRFDPEDLAQEAFVRILGALRRGKGPRESFRAYLYATIRSISMNWVRDGRESVPLDEVAMGADPEAVFEDDLLDRTITGRAFAGLRPEWQTVLWYTEVEGLSAREVGEYLGLTPNAASALALRAREGLRAAWLQAHVSADGVDEGCRSTVERLGAYRRGALGRRATDDVESHLTVCVRCAILVEEIDQVAGRLGAVLLPLLLGPGVWSLTAAGSAASAPAGSAAAGAAGVASTVSTVTSVFATGSFLLAAVVAGASFAGHDDGAGERAGPAPAPVVAERSGESVVVPASLPRTPEDEVDAPTGIAGAPGQQPTDAGPETRAPAPDADRGDVASWTPPVASLRHDDPAAPEQVPAPAGVDPAEQAAARASAGATSPTEPEPEPEPAPEPEPGPDAPEDPTEPTELVPPAPPRIAAVDSAGGLVAPLLTGEADAGATVRLVDAGTGMEVTRTEADDDGAWSAVVPLAHAGATVLASQDTGDGTSAASEPVDLPELAVPQAHVLVDGVPEPRLRYSGAAGAHVETFIDGTATGNVLELVGGAVDRRAVGFAPGHHTISLRYVDPASGRHGHLVAVDLTVTS